MRAALIVATREYLENARTKGFWIGIFLIPIILAVAGYVPYLLETRGTPTRHFALVDQSTSLEAPIMDALEKAHQRRVLQDLQAYLRRHAAEPARNLLSAPPGRDPVEFFMTSGGPQAMLEKAAPHLRPNAPEFTEPRRQFQRVPLPGHILPNSDLPLIAEELRPYLRGEERIQAGDSGAALFAAVLIPQTFGQPPAVEDGENANVGGASPSPSPIEYWSSNLADQRLRDQILQAVNQNLRQRQYTSHGIDVHLIRQIEATQAPFIDLNPKRDVGDQRVTRSDLVRQWAPVGFVYVLWIALFSISQMLLNNVIEEKSNRIIEVLLSSVTPGELMVGKLAGIAAVGLTMVSVWVVSGIGVALWMTRGQPEIGGEIVNLARSTHLIPAFIAYFFLGYLLYASFILALGSVCNTIKEAQNYMAVITIMMMVPLLIMMPVARDPNGTLATVLSWIPIYTPFVMMNRAAADPPIRDVAGTLLLLCATLVLTLWMSAKIFRLGILRTGQPPRLIEMFRWIWQRH